MPQITEAEVYRACRILFGADLRLDQDFLKYLQPAGARSAYRKKAKATHPDQYNFSGDCVQARQVKLFQDLNQAHELLQSYLKQRDIISTRPHTYGSHSSFHQNRSTYRHSRPYSRHYRGQLPSRPLQFGLFLYYRGLIPFNTVISSVTWQRQQRPTMGEIARRWGWLTQEDTEKVLQLKGFMGKFGERAEHLGLLSNIQVRALLLHQRTRQKQLGRYFIEQGLISESDLDHLLTELSDHNLRHRHNFPGEFYYRR